MGAAELLVKDEGRLPTGSFKARGLVMAVSMAKSFGITHMAMPTNGNAGAALAAYATGAGIRTTIFCPADTPEVKVSEIELQVFQPADAAAPEPTATLPSRSPDTDLPEPLIDIIEAADSRSSSTAPQPRADGRERPAPRGWSAGWQATARLWCCGPTARSASTGTSSPRFT
nr:pyridoxal-phosphate dependent enzyme [Azospirillum sp. INR13]